jgi:hypothetical protein
MNIKKIGLWIAQIVVAGILLQTLYFKFSGAPESIYIFEKIGIEPWGRYLSGIAELIAGVLLLTPLSFLGAIIALLVIVPALFFHLTSLGIEVQGDGGLLFGMAITVLILSLIIIFVRRLEIKQLFKRLFR